ncbi:MAG: hypothetical protein ACYC9M_09405 [Desulfobulbaceae bacterium]
MKIDILRPPPADIFKNRGRYIIIFSVLLVLACCGLLIGLYAIVADTRYYAKLEIVALALFAGSAVFLTYFGEKLQNYKKLTPPELKELADLGRKHIEIKAYCDLLAQANRRPIRAEYEACQEWAELFGGKQRKRD